MNKKIFISFAYEDKSLRDLLVGQARNENSPFEFVDMSVKVPWDRCWKTKCREKIKRCDGFIAIITNNTLKADGQLWEIECAKYEGIPISAVWGYKQQFPYIYELQGIKPVVWTWENIKKSISLF